MNRSARVFTALLLALVLGVLAVPVGFHYGPQVAELVTGPPPQAEPEIPVIQQTPDDVAAPTLVSQLDAQAPVPVPDVLAPLLAAALEVPGGTPVTGVVLDALTGEVLFDRGGGEPQLPASNIKILTATAALAKLDPNQRLTTSVLTGGAGGEGVLVLRGGGDVLLGSGESDAESVIGHAGLATLARETAAQLDGDGPYRVVIDDSLFVGDVLNPSWQPGDVQAGEIAPIYPLAINSSWTDESKQSGARAADAALAAATVFREALLAAGVQVEEGIERQVTGEDAEEVASVESATVEALVEHMLRTSDNYLAEVLARLAAEASGRPASFGGGLETIAEVIAGLEVQTEEMVLGDASGLSPRNRISPRQLSDVVRTLLRSDNRALRHVLHGLPVASLSGTLADRYNDDDAPTFAGAGLVRAKTGTLNAVTALSGHVVSVDGRLLVFSFIASGLDGTTEPARAAVDRAAAVLATCGCR
ncbi:D-alanyl-D-alanine carboxypeptidase/D-alanyl-D-alanine-endopeptidase [Arthrobacter sp. EH-1B-1]|uniref:D-alanyl-D-alanine carboxypeptidase/D-alanyl-D-alanine-endopeptidase n=1 Tax=Arthrobacter vasquezii TaxID=2977629 RepID=A0ABT6CZV1_9MICC|nr:D-alanyl-D-alanine carboxypeptidase/D-alanyl-D-alanine-endopeptidase [Arthrobacter vasquezii]MDF9278997.1 D-alanyl-D-alanine carboxypeptidase/D-alanyl-D-alanine-endopeptidase [Arthrobacter vasquezii]